MVQKLCFLLFLLPLIAFTQNDTILKGKIVSESYNLEDVHVINRTKEKGKVTEIGGYFSINASVGDTIIFSAVHLTAVQHVVKKNDFGENLLFIKMKPHVNPLEEVTLVEYKNINAVALGIVPAGQKTYTPAERKLYTATGGGNRYGLSTSVSLDGILNGLSGRTKMLKKELIVERKEMLIEQLKSDFNDLYLTSRLMIPADYVDGFRYFAVESESFIKIYNSNNKTATQFLLLELSIMYLDVISSDKNLNESKKTNKL